MQLINSSAFREGFSERIAWLLPLHDPYADLCDKTWVELAVNPSGFALYSGANPQVGLAKARFFREGMDAVPVLASLPSGTKLLVSFDTALCFESTERVPFLSDRKTNDILSYSNLRTLPMDPEEYIWGWFRSSQVQNLQECKSLVLKRSVVNAVLNSVDAAGSRCAAVVFRSNGQASFPIALSPEGVPFNRGRFKRWTKSFITAVAGLCMVIAIFTIATFVRQAYDADTIAQSNDMVAKDVKVLKDQMAGDRAFRQAGFDFQTKKFGEVPKIKLLNEITSLLPDDTYLTSIVVDDRTLSIDGYAQSPEGLVAVLEASKLIKNVAFTGPVTHNPGEEKSRFSMRMDVESPNAMVVP